jgi:hemerythrin-like domain-containing protein
MIESSNRSDPDYGRRSFVKKSLEIAVVAGFSGIISACSTGKEKEDEEQKVSPPEDLMQEHGLLNRILLIYDTCKTQLQAKQFLQKDSLFNAASIVREFVENYHEKQEEDYLFPRFEKANQLTDLVRTLRQQHDAGRLITSKILNLTKQQTHTDSELQSLSWLLSDFNTMYRPHEAREDTVLFPAFRKIVSPHEYDSIGEDFEKNEHKLFGENGFEKMVEKVSGIEKSLGIYELAQFTPKK